MLSLKRFEPRLIPNMQMVQDWNLGTVEVDLSICPSREINRNFKAHVSTGEFAYISTHWLDNDKTPIILLDNSYFNRFNYSTTGSYPIIKVSSSKYDLQFKDAIAKPTHLRIISSTLKGISSLLVQHSLYGTFTLNNIMCTCNPILTSDVLLVPDHLWDFLKSTVITIV